MYVTHSGTSVHFVCLSIEISLISSKYSLLCTVHEALYKLDCTCFLLMRTQVKSSVYSTNYTVLATSVDTCGGGGKTVKRIRSQSIKFVPSPHFPIRHLSHHDHTAQRRPRPRTMRSLYRTPENPSLTGHRGDIQGLRNIHNGGLSRWSILNVRDILHRAPRRAAAHRRHM